MYTRPLPADPPLYFESWAESHLQLDYSPTNPHPQLRKSKPSSEPTTQTAEKRVPRPRNAFMIFRSAFWAEQKINRTVEHDHRHISRIVGHYWNKMSNEDKDFWRRKADQEKVEHEMKHPGYRFCPTARTKKPLKRKVKRNGVDDLLRCQQVADLLLSGKEGKELDDAVKSLKSFPEDEESKAPPPGRSWSEEPPFRSPLLPPVSLQATPASSPIEESFPLTPPYSEEAPEHVMVVNSTSSPSSSSILFQTGSIPPLAYSVYHAQANAHHAINSFDLSLDPISMTGFPQHIPFSEPRVVTAFYNPYALCDSSSAPPLPAPESSANIMAEPILWTAPFPFSS